MVHRSEVSERILNFLLLTVAGLTPRKGTQTYDLKTRLIKPLLEMITLNNVT